MKISCQSCQSKYNVADEKVQGKVVKIRCRKCGATIVVDGNANAPAGGTNGSAAGAGAAEAGGDGQWHVNVSETDQRSMSLGELVDAYNASVVTQETFIWTDGMDDWRPLGDVEAVVAALHAAAGSGQAEAPAYAGHQPHEPGGEREDAPTQAFSYDQAAAGGYDLPFDGQQAAQAQAAAPEPRRAAVNKPRSRDLFGEGGGGGDEVQTSAPSMAQAQSMARASSAASAASAAAHDAASSMTGERNENSVLFSLAALTKNSGPADVPPPPAGSKDDSGLIDLKALALKTQSSRPVAPKVDADLFSAPLGFTPAPLGAPLGAMGSTGGEAQAKSKLPLLIGGGVGVLLLMVVSVVVTLKVAGSSAPAPSAALSAAPPPPSATASAEPAPSTTAEASAAASASAAPTAKPKPVYTGGGTPKPAGGAAAKPAGAGGAAAPAATAAAAPGQTAAPKKASGCEAACAGDLMCLMKCSTH